uniref:Phosphoethanolamine transferase n=1 Tax=Klebsiella pneumoniae TaxID=573 RepID=A0A2I7QFI7_KLEPN|nr:phosphoethanolamine--lipid A transferase MCR-7.1 [Klebsiella pneumoniae]AUR80098.1 Phosphoethanolamine transferase [Klebsiella pneumoniae]BCG50373.1 lipid A phosphoethanolamine transferase MCR-7 [Expression vector pUC57-Kan-mcr-7]
MRITLGVMKVNLLLVLFFALVLNWPFFLRFYSVISGLEHVRAGFVISVPLVLLAALNAVFIPFTFRWLLKPFFSLLILTGSIVSYAMLKYGVIFDASMIQNIVETNNSEATSYLNVPVVLWFLLTGVLPMVVLWSLKVRYPANWYKGLAIRAGALAFSLLFVGGVAALYYQDYVSIGRNHRILGKQIVPANYVNGIYKYARDVVFATPIPYQPLGTDAKVVAKGDKPTLMFLVVGETARGKNFSMNGYEKETNPFTSQAGGVISFKDVRSCGTATAVSVPCMFSNMGRKEFDDNRARNSEGLLDVLQRSGVSIFWKENDGGCKGVCDRVPNIEIKPKDHPQFCDKNTCYDEVVLQNLDDEVAQMKGDKLVGFHLIGSHRPPYHQRYPDKPPPFVPDCPRSDIENCSDEELVNTYDNTIRYTDFVIAEMITKLKKYEDKYNTALIYLSDHGESLGAMGLYLHGTPYKFAPDDQTRVPMQVWMSPGFAKEKGMDLNCLQQKAADNRYSHDNLFSSVLGIWDVSTAVYDKQLDIFSQCRTVQ